VEKRFYFTIKKKINLLTTISMKRSRRELSFDTVIDRGVSKNNKITLVSYFNLPETGMGLLKAGVTFC